MEHISEYDNLKTIQMRCHPRSCNTEPSKQYTTEHRRPKSQHLPQTNSKKFGIEAQQNHMGLQINDPHTWHHDFISVSYRKKDALQSINRKKVYEKQENVWLYSIFADIATCNQLESR